MSIALGVAVGKAEEHLGVLGFALRLGDWQG